MTKPVVLGRPISRAVRGSQGGAVLVVGLIMLVLITLIVVSAFTMSASNLKSVGNMQIRNEAIAAANQVIEAGIEGMLVKVGSNEVFTVNPSVPYTTQTVDINHDGVADFSIRPVFTCIRALKAANALGSDVELGTSMSSAAEWHTEWDVSATVIDAASGASVEVHQGVRIRLKQADKDTACP